MRNTMVLDSEMLDIRVEWFVLLLHFQPNGQARQ